VTKRNSPETAEEHLRIYYKEGFAPAFEKQGYTLPWPVDIDFGFTSSGARKGPGGEFYAGAASTHGVPKINIRCDDADIDRILTILGHQCVHAAVGAAEGHGKKFFVCAQRMQYEGSKMRETVPGPELMERVHALAESLGPFPRGALKFGTHDHAGEKKPPKLSADHPEKQKNRQLKAECLIEDCGYIARVSAMNLREKGPPICPVHKQPMWHEPLPVDCGLRAAEPREMKDVTPRPEPPEPAQIEHRPGALLEYLPPVPGDGQ
jgi:hypothetical protein